MNSCCFVRDEDQKKALLTYLRIPKLIENHSFLIICESRKLCEEITNMLNKEGFKALSINYFKTLEAQKSAMYSFIKRNTDILVTIEGFYLD